jgi:ABC-type transport system involved in multi-copper enzyme maturation permease subunit
MKFIAILKDSLREAIDAKVFYVMVGLSLLLILLGMTATFSPRPGGKMVMEMASIPLSIDLKNLDPLEFQNKGGDPTRLLGRLRGVYKVIEVSPLDNAEDLPTSTFRVTVQPQGAIPFLVSKPAPEKAIEQIRERFGQWDDKRLAEVVNVTHDKGNYLIDARLTTTGRRMWPHDFALFFGALPIIREGVPLGLQLYFLENILVNQVGSWVTILVSVVITAFFIPNMLRKGTVDMLIVKPIHRVTLLLYKFCGGLLFILINTTIAVGGVWLALSWRSGIWAPGFLVAIPVITFFFAILYSVSTLFGVLTRSPIVSILMTCGVWFILFVVGLVNLIFDSLEKEQAVQVRRNASQMAVVATTLSGLPSGSGPLLAANVLHVQTNRLRPYEQSPSTFARVVRAIHFVLPRTRDLDTLMTMNLERDLMVLPRNLGSQAVLSRTVSWGESLTVSGVFIAVMLGLSCWWFATRDY